MTQTEILTNFKNRLVEFLDELNDIIPNDPDLLTLRMFIKDQAIISDLMNTFIQKLYPYRDKVLKRDDKFFLGEESFFTSIKPETFLKFKKYWNSNEYLNNDDRKTIWTWVDLFFILGKKYIESLNR